MPDKIVSSVYRTTSYECFQNLCGNRQLGGRPAKIIKSIQENGYIMNPIVVNENYEVIDGQARLEAEKRLGIPVDYVVCPGLTIKDCVALNAHSTSWTLQDYVESFASVGNENYIRLNKLKEAHRPGLQTIANIVEGLYGSAEKNRKVGSNAIKSGDLIVTEFEYMIADQKLSYIDTFAPFLKKAGGNFDYWSLALSFCYDLEEVDNAKLQERVRTRALEIHPCSNIVTALEELERCYNHNSKKGKVYISTEYDKMQSEKVKGYFQRWSRRKKEEN